MGLLDFFKSKDSTQSHQRLLGEWRLIKGDDLENGDGVSVKFLPKGKLIYIIELKDRKQIINLSFRVDGKYLVTDQPFAHKEEKTKFSFDAKGNLVLQYGGKRSWFVRV